MSSLLGPTLLSEAPRASGQTWPRYCSWPAAITPNGSAMRQVLPPSAVPRPWRRRREMTIRHRLNRAGNRQANHALWRIATVRLSCDPATQAYAKRRRSEGKSDREIVRCLKPLRRPVRFDVSPDPAAACAERGRAAGRSGRPWAEPCRCRQKLGHLRQLHLEARAWPRSRQRLSPTDMSASSPISVQSLRPVHPHSAHPSPLTPFSQPAGLTAIGASQHPQSTWRRRARGSQGAAPVPCQPTEALAPTGPGSGAARVRSPLNVLYGEVGLKESTFHRSGGPDARAARTEPI